MARDRRPWSQRSVGSRWGQLIAIWFGGGLPLLLLAVAVHPVFLVPLFLLMIFVGTTTLESRCPRCRAKVLKRNPDLVMSPYLGWLPRECPKCGLSTTSEWPLRATSKN
jgi:hypothetical protein